MDLDEVMQKASDFDPTADIEQPAHEVERDAQGKCVKCGGLGVLKDQSYCDCQMGRDLRVAKRKAKSETKTGTDYMKGATQ
jgi:hypothetical protein